MAGSLDSPKVLEWRRRAQASASPVPRPKNRSKRQAPAKVMNMQVAGNWAGCSGAVPMTARTISVATDSGREVQVAGSCCSAARLALGKSGRVRVGTKTLGNGQNADEPSPQGAMRCADRLHPRPVAIPGVACHSSAAWETPTLSDAAPHELAVVPEGHHGRVNHRRFRAAAVPLGCGAGGHREVSGHAAVEQYDSGFCGGRG